MMRISEIARGRSAWMTLHVFLTLIFGTASSDLAQQPVQVNDVLLEDGKPFESALGGGQSRSYKINVEAGQYVQVIIAQRRIDVVALLSAPDGKLVSEVDSPNGANGPEPVYIFAEAAGEYRLVVKSFYKGAPPGRYEIKIAERRLLSKHDDSRRAALTSFSEAEKLRNVGRRDSYEASIGKYQTALDLYRTIGDQREQAKMLIGMGLSYEALFDYPKMLDRSNQALDIARKLEDRQVQATILERIAAGYRAISDLDNALKTRIAMLGIIQSLDDPVNEADSNWKIGQLLSLLGENERAREYLAHAIAIYQKIGDRETEAYVLQEIGYSYDLQEDTKKTLEYYNRSLTIATDLKQRTRIAALSGMIATINADAGDRQAAVDNITRALEYVDKQRVGYYSLLTNVGLAYYKLGEFETALGYLNQTLPVWRSSGNKRSEAIALRHIAVVLRDQGKLTQAAATIDQSIALVEFLRDHAGSPEQQASFVSTLFSYYEVSIDIKMRLDEADPSAGYTRSAFEFAEKVKVRGLIDLLRKAGVDTTQDVDPLMIAREAKLNAGLTDRLDELSKLERNSPTEQQKTAAGQEVYKAQDALNDVRAKIRESSPHYAALTAPQPLSVSDIQSRVLDDDTILIEYQLGDDRSYMWTVSRDGVKSYRLPKRTVIVDLSKRVYGLLTARTPGKTRNTKADEIALKRESQKLSNMLLGPAAAYLGTKRLAIVGDGVLQYLPFATLPVPETGSKRSTAYRPMLLDHEIVSLPSASVLAVLRAEFGKRRSAPLTAAVFADPVYSSDDSRIKRTASGAATDTRSGSSTGSFSRLLFSRDEADAILSVTSPLSSLKVLDFEANRSLAMSDELAKYRIVHFSTHGVFDSRRPELSGIVLSQVGKTGEPVQGSIRLHEVYNMRLNADLVVLSGCQTGLGKDISGEGLIGLTRGFMYAGAPRVVASLWQVDDAATAELMKRFYTGMLQKGMTPAAALRAAQIEMFKKRLWQSPYYWGAFVLQGEWK